MKHRLYAFCLIFPLILAVSCILTKKPKLPNLPALPEYPAGDASGLRDYDPDKPLFQIDKDGAFVQVRLPDADNKLQKFGTNMLLFGVPFLVIGLAAAACLGNKLVQAVGNAAGFAGGGLAASGLFLLMLAEWLHPILFVALCCFAAVVAGGIIYAIRNKSVLNLFRKKSASE